MKEAIQLMEAALQLERMATLVLVAIGGSVVYVISYKIPPMIANTLDSLSKSLERISVTMAELVINSTRIAAETNSHNTVLTVHHENALEIKGLVGDLDNKVQRNSDTLYRIETTLHNRPCIK